MTYSKQKGIFKDWILRRGKKLQDITKSTLGKKKEWMSEYFGLETVSGEPKTGLVPGKWSLINKVGTLIIFKWRIRPLPDKHSRLQETTILTNTKRPGNYPLNHLCPSSTKNFYI